MKKILCLCTAILVQISLSNAQVKPVDTNNQGDTYITCRVQKGTQPDTLCLILDGSFWSYQLHLVPERYSVKTLKAIINPKGEYIFKIKTDGSPFHITLFLSSKRNEDGYLDGKPRLSNYLIMPGSDIHIDFNGDEQTFSGKGSDLFIIQNKIENSDEGGQILNDATLRTSNTKKWLNQKDSLLQVQLDLLNLYKSKTPPLEYSIIRADVIGKNRGAVYYWMSYAQPYMANRVDLSKKLEDAYQKLEAAPPYIDSIDNSSLSPKYIFYLYEKIKLETKHERILAKLPPKIDQNYFPIIEKNYGGVLRDKLFAFWISDVASVNNLKPEYASEALALMHTPRFIKIVNDLADAYQKGQSIIDFNFQDAKGRTVHLNDFKGKVIIVDMWFTGCEVCQKVATRLSHIEEKFKGRTDIVFISISIDRDKKKWLNSIDKANGKYYITPTTIYLNTAGTGDRNPFISEYVPSGSYPSMLILDKEGKIFSSTPTHPLDDDTQKVFVNEITQALKGK